MKPPMTAPLAEQVAAALAEHQTEQLWKPGGWAGDTACSCGWRMGMWSRKDFPEVHRAHQADAVLRVVAEWLGSEAVRYRIEVALGNAEQFHAENYRPSDGAAYVVSALSVALRPPDAPNAPAPVSADMWVYNVAADWDGTEGRDEKEPCPSCERDLSYPGAPGHECYTRAEHAARIAANSDTTRPTTPPGPPGPPGPPSHEHGDGSQCMWVTRGGIDRWRQVDPTGWDLGPCPGLDDTTRPAGDDPREDEA